MIASIFVIGSSIPGCRTQSPVDAALRSTVVSCMSLGRVRSVGMPAGAAQGGDDVLGVSRNAVFVKIEPKEFAFFRNTQRPGEIHQIHQQHRDRERRGYDDRAANELSLQQGDSAAVKHPCQRCEIIRTGRSRSAVLAAGEEAEGKRSPDAAQAVHRNRANWIVDAQLLKSFNAQAYQNPGNAAEDDCARETHPVAGTGNGHQSRKESVDRETDVPFLARKWA